MSPPSLDALPPLEGEAEAVERIVRGALAARPRRGPRALVAAVLALLVLGAIGAWELTERGTATDRGVLFNNGDVLVARSADGWRIVNRLGSAGESPPTIQIIRHGGSR